jgi:hypothetical protein
MSELTQAELFFGSDDSVVSTYGPSLADSMNQLCDRDGVSEADKDRLMLEASRFFSQAGIRHDVAAKFYGDIAERLEHPPAPEVANKWQSDGRQYLRERYPDDGERRAEIVNTYLASFPRVGPQLAVAGVDPPLYRALLDRAYSLRPRSK